MCHRTLGLLGLAGAVLLFGCAHPTMTGSSQGDIGADSDSAAAASNNGIVFTGKQLWQRNTDLLTALRGHIATMEVAQTLGCPAVSFRGQTSLTNLSDPRIYVNGSPAANTCILEALNTVDLRRVEVYTSGISGRPGYFNDANGLILIFTKRSTEP